MANYLLQDPRVQSATSYLGFLLIRITFRWSGEVGHWTHAHLPFNIEGAYSMPLDAKMNMHETVFSVNDYDNERQ